MVDTYHNAWRRKTCQSWDAGTFFLANAQAQDLSRFAHQGITRKIGLV